MLPLPKIATPPFLLEKSKVIDALNNCEICNCSRQVTVVTKVSEVVSYPIAYLELC